MRVMMVGWGELEAAEKPALLRQLEPILGSGFSAGRAVGGAKRRWLREHSLLSFSTALARMLLVHQCVRLRFIQAAAASIASSDCCSFGTAAFEVALCFTIAAEWKAAFVSAAEPRC